jgi:hypothetical protein
MWFTAPACKNGRSSTPRAGGAGPRNEDPEGSGEPQGGGPVNQIGRPAAISVGTNPQFGTDRRVEAHVLDFDGDLYGHRVSVDVTHRLRGQATFADVEELAAQIRADVDQTRRLLLSPPGGTVRTGGFSRPTP